jgi:hypothetical protein
MVVERDSETEREREGGRERETAYVRRSRGRGDRKGDEGDKRKHNLEHASATLVVMK